MTETLTKPSPDVKAEEFIRGMIAQRAGGATFDKGGSYVFTEMLNAERKLQKSAVIGNPSSPVLAFSVADPVTKIKEENFESGVEFYQDSPDATRYTDLNGVRNIVIGDNSYLNTQEALANILNSKYPKVGLNSPITPEMVQYTYDSIKGPLATHIPTAFFDSNSVILMPNPSYGVIASEVNRCDASVYSFPIDSKGSSFTILLKTLKEALKDALKDIDKEKKTKVFLYLNVPHNPTGFVFTHKMWKNVLAWAVINNVMLIVDEAYTELDFTGDAASVIEVDGWESNCIILQSVSKAHGATGLRFGYILAHPVAIKVLRKVIDCKNSGAFGPNIIIGLECLSDINGAEKTREYYKTCHLELADALGKAGFPAQIPEAGLCQLTGFPKSACLKVESAKHEFEHEFEKPSDFASWLRETLKISVMPQDAISKIRWAVTFRPQPEFGLETEADVLAEVGNRLGKYQFEF